MVFYPLLVRNLYRMAIKMVKPVKDTVQRLSANEQVDVMARYTEAYRANAGSHAALREAACLAAQFPAMLGFPQEGDLWVGRLLYLPICFTPQHSDGETGYCCISQRVELLLGDDALDGVRQKKLSELLTFWEKEKTKTKIEALYTEEMRKAMPHEDFTTYPGAAFPMYRIAGAQFDYSPLLSDGVPVWIERLKKQSGTLKAQFGEWQLTAAMAMALETLLDCCSYFAADLRKKERCALFTEEKKSYSAIAEGLEHLILGPPQSLREAIQLVLLYFTLSGAMNLGRMDVYLSGFLRRDLRSGAINEEEALRLLQEFWRMLETRRRVYDIRITIGGRGRENEAEADCFALLAMEATRTVKEVTPQLTLRFYEGQNPRLMEKALDVIGEGRTYPMLYNDDVNIPAVQSAMGVSAKEAAGYVPLGCGEYMLFGKSIATPSGAINLLKVLELTLNYGQDLSGEARGLNLGGLPDYTTFEDLFGAYQNQAEYFVRVLARQQKMEYDGCAVECCFLYTTLFYSDCLAKNKALLSGGVRHLGGTLESYGNINTADSLCAIRRAVYTDRFVSGKELLDSLRNNFGRNLLLRRRLLELPKYGNDCEEADGMAARVHDHICRFTQSQAREAGLDSYLIVLINNKANSDMGLLTGASADGRMANTFLANANNPMGGRDKNGLTAMLNSLVKLETHYHAGAVQNLKLSPSLFHQKRGILTAMLNTYFEKGGAQLMITVVSRSDLENALEHPERYANLMVRVGGFSARYVELQREVQLEILSRTLYDE